MQITKTTQIIQHGSHGRRIVVLSEGARDEAQAASLKRILSEKEYSGLVARGVIQE